jgi:hypothetical protein
MPFLPRGEPGLEPIGILKYLLPLEGKERCERFKLETIPYLKKHTRDSQIEIKKR